MEGRRPLSVIGAIARMADGTRCLSDATPTGRSAPTLPTSEGLRCEAGSTSLRRAATSCPAIAPHQDLPLYSDRITRVVDHRNELHAPRERARLSSVSSLRQILAAVRSIRSRLPPSGTRLANRVGMALPLIPTNGTFATVSTLLQSTQRAEREQWLSPEAAGQPAGESDAGAARARDGHPLLPRRHPARPASTPRPSRSTRSADCPSWTGRSWRSRAKTRFSPCRARG